MHSLKWALILVLRFEDLWFENILQKKTGQGFQDLFTALAKQSWGEDFEPWKAQGRLGDFKCDGYHVPTKTVYQCHGPEKTDNAVTSSKIERDFNGAKAHFKERMQKWVFIYNRQDLPAGCGMLLNNLRDQNPEITIRNWVQLDLQNFAKDLGPERLANLFPELQGDHKVTDVAMQALKEFTKEYDAKKFAADAINATIQTNQITLDQALDALGGNDRDIRLRVLGYCKWLDPLTIKRGVELLAKKGYAEAAISTNIERLKYEGYVQVTKLH